MPLESNPADYRDHLTNGALAPPSDTPPAEHISSSAALITLSADQPLDDGLHGKAPTLSIDIPADLPKPITEIITTAAEGRFSPKYIQGIVQNHHAHIITNLLGDASESILQPQSVWTIGRNREVALPIGDKAMSRRHAVLRYVQDAGFYLTDLNSMNGSYVNGVCIKHRLLLQDGDFIQMGNTGFTFFQSRQQRRVEALHPEVLARLIASKSPLGHVDFLALEEPEISFRILT
jgi:FHA domain